MLIDAAKQPAHDRKRHQSTGDLRRDYFVATTAQGAWLWVFRDPAGWWLHGYFG